MRIAVTGAAGELGREVVLEALRRGFSVVAIDLAPGMQPPLHPELLQHICDLSDFDSVLRGLDGADAIIHLAVHAATSAHDAVVHNGNVTVSYNVLRAAAELGIKRICMASSLNAIGLTYSRRPRYQYFPVDENHATFNEDAYGLSKWIGEVQADSVARRYEDMTISSLRFHWVSRDRETVNAAFSRRLVRGARHLWGYTPLASAVRACFLGFSAEFKGHHSFNVVAPDTAVDVPSHALARRFYPGVPIRGEFAGNCSFFSCAKAARLLGY